MCLLWTLSPPSVAGSAARAVAGAAVLYLGLIVATLDLGLILAILEVNLKSIPTPFKSTLQLEVGNLTSGVDRARFRLGGGSLNQAGRAKDLTWSAGNVNSFKGLEQKKRSLSASSLSNEATEDPWMLATPRTTRLRYKSCGANCFKTYDKQTNH